MRTLLLATGLLTAWLLLAPAAFAQETPDENLLEEQTESSDQSELFERLQELREHPLNLNQATRQDFERIPGLSAALIEHILDYRDKKGPFRSVETLLAVPGMDRAVYDYIEPFVTVESHKKTSRPAIFRFRSRVSDPIDRAVGFKDGTYPNSPQKLYTRLQFGLHERVRGGLLMEKDSGERRLDDLRLYHLTVRLNDRALLFLGDYTLEIGQGLVLWGPYGFSKNAEAIYPLRKRPRGLRGYLTVDENAALRGAATRLRLGAAELLAFASRKKLDATLSSDNEVSNLFTTGLHRTTTEENKKDVLTESVFGGHLSYILPVGLRLGLSYVHSGFDKTVNSSDLVRKRYAFRGKTNELIGGNWTWDVRHYQLFGEFARSKSGGTALVAGMILDFDTLRLGFLHRNYQKDFQNFRAFGFGERNGATQNEVGYYTGLEYKPGRHTTVRAYYDIFRQPWRTFFSPLPGQGQELLAQVEQRLGRRVTIMLRFRQKTKAKTQRGVDSRGRAKEEFFDETVTRWRVQADVHLSRRFTLRSRVELALNSKHGLSTDGEASSEKGVLFFEEVKWRALQHLTVVTRLSFFDTDSFASRVFQYEHDVPGVVTNRALFGTGERWYLLLSWQPASYLRLTTKLAATMRRDVDAIGSGPDRIEGHLDRRIRAQVDMQF